MQLNNKNVLITGAANGIGAALARQLVAAGCRLLLVDIDAEKLKLIVNEIKSLGHEPIAMVKDLSLSSERESVFFEMVRLNCFIDIIINNVSIGYWKNYKDTPWGKAEKIIDTNIKCMAQMTKMALPEMLKKDEAMIVNVSSTAAFIGSPKGVVYAATKAFIRSFSESLDMELKGDKVNVLCVYPGATTTPFWENAGMSDSDYFKKVNKMSAEEVADQIITAMRKGKKECVIGVRNKINMLLVRLLPRCLIKQAALNRFKEQ